MHSLVAVGKEKWVCGRKVRLRDREDVQKLAKKNWGEFGKLFAIHLRQVKTRIQFSNISLSSMQKEY